MREKRHDWEAIRQAYVTGVPTAAGRVLPTFRELADQYHVGFAYLRSTAGAQRWNEKRQLFRAEAEQKRRMVLVGELAVSAVKMDRQCFEIYSGVIEMIGQEILAMQKPRGKVDAAKLSTLLDALRKAKAGTREASGAAVTVANALDSEGEPEADQPAQIEYATHQ